jgi:hypothetical protein
VQQPAPRRKQHLSSLRYPTDIPDRKLRKREREKKRDRDREIHNLLSHRKKLLLSFLRKGAASSPNPICPNPEQQLPTTQSVLVAALHIRSPNKTRSGLLNRNIAEQKRLGYYIKMSTQNITPCKTFLQKPKNKDFLRKTNTK